MTAIAFSACHPMLTIATEQLVELFEEATTPQPVLALVRENLKIPLALPGSCAEGGRFVALNRRGRPVDPRAEVGPFTQHAIRFWDVGYLPSHLRIQQMLLINRRYRIHAVRIGGKRWRVIGRLPGHLVSRFSGDNYLEPSVLVGMTPKKEPRFIGKLRYRLRLAAAFESLSWLIN